MEKDLPMLNEVLSQAIKGNTSARIDLSSIAEAYRPTAELINTLIERIEKKEERSTKAIKRAQDTIEKLCTGEFALKSAISNFGSVLSSAAKGDLTTKVDLSSIFGEYKPIGEDINKMISATEKNIEEIHKREAELSQTLSVCEEVVNGVIQKGDLAGRVDISKLSGKHKQIGRGINEIMNSMRSNIEELRKRQTEYADAISAFSKVLSKATTGDLSARVDTKGWSEELEVVGMVINSLLESLEFEKKQKD
jgi:cysteinyl-tRNA synthetase